MTAGLRHHDWIAHHHSVGGDRLAYRDLDVGPAAGRRLSYTELHRRTDQLAGHLQSLGVGRGHRVAMLAHNGSEFFELQFACGRIGCIAVLLNWRLTVPELQYILDDCTPSVLIHDIAFAPVARELSGLCHVRDLLCIDADADTGGANPYEQALLAAPAPEWVPLTHDDISTIMYTSGTTGHPKGAMITHGMTFWNCINLGIPARITPDSVHFVVLPLFHTGGLNCYANPVLHAGGSLVTARTFDAGQALRAIGDPGYGITHFFGVPAPYQFMMQHPDFETTDLSRLQVAGVGGAPCALTILETWAGCGVEIVQGYGMTETSPSVTMLDAADAMRKLGSAGKGVMHCEVRIVAEDGTDAAPGAVGELWTRGPNVTPGYWNRPDATASSFEGDWLKTGDAARYDDDGFIFIVDRWKDMYISGGENVYPAEVENVVYQLPGVAEAAVIGVPSDRWGEVGMAVIVRRPGVEGDDLDERTVVTHCVSRLAKFKVPATVTFTDVLPRNATGKVLKRELRARFIGADAPAIT